MGSRRSSPFKDFLLLHGVVFVWGFTAILGKLISLDALTLVWHRVLVALAGIFFYVRIRGLSLSMSSMDAMKLLCAGGVITAHWICFFHAIKVSNASVTLACLSSGALFVSFLEPLAFGRKIAWHEVACGILAIFSLYLIFHFETRYKTGIALSLLASFLSALFAVINGKFALRHRAETISLYEMVGGLMWLSAYLFWSGRMNPDLFALSRADCLYLAILGLVCTAFAFVTSVRLLDTISPYTMILTTNLEPVYGIIMAYLVFGEDEKMSPGFYAGTALILAVIVANTVITAKLRTELEPAPA
jgi:drug/metabolite transporter (DMT)-like permease